jgi:hypothetical protein
MNVKIKLNILMHELCANKVVSLVVSLVSLLKLDL